jgi:hypothetical protein
MASSRHLAVPLRVVSELREECNGARLPTPLGCSGSVTSGTPRERWYQPVQCLRVRAGGDLRGLRGPGEQQSDDQSKHE